MPSFNSITIIGHLGRDPELRYTPQGKAVCDFSIATSDRKKDKGGEYQEVTTWFRVTMFGSTAENVAKYLKKGSLAYVSGRLSQEEWTDRDGNLKTSLAVMASEVKFLGGRDENVKAQAASQADVAFTGTPKDDDSSEIPF